MPATGELCVPCAEIGGCDPCDTGTGGIGGGDVPDISASPPTTEGGLEVLRLETPGTTGQGVLVQRRGKYNIPLLETPLHLDVFARVSALADFAAFIGFAPPGSAPIALATGELDSSVACLGLIKPASASTFYMVASSGSGNASYANSNIAAGTFAHMGLRAEGSQPGWVTQYAGDREAAVDVRTVLPARDVGLALTLCVVDRANTVHYLEVGGLYAAQDNHPPGAE